MNKPPQSVGFGTLAGYGSLEAGVSAVESFLRLYLLIYYTDRVGIDPKWAGLAVALGVLWDAVMDPVVGSLCDRTRSRVGRRLPWIIVGAPMFAVCVLATFSVPADLSMTQKIIWLFACNIAVNTSMAAVSIPHLALGSDVSGSSENSTKLYAWRMLMSIIGLFAGVAVPAAIRSHFDDSLKLQAVGFESVDTLTAAAFSVIVVFTSLITVLVFMPRTYKSQASSLVATLRTPVPFKEVVHRLKGPPFIMLFFGYAVATFGQGLNSSLALYYYKYRLAFSETELQSTLLVFMLVLIVSLPLWVIASRFFGKHLLLASGVFALGVFTVVGYPLIPEKRVDLAMLVGGLGGLSLGCIALFESHLTDLMSAYGFSEDSNASVFGIWKFLAKSARAAAIASSGYLLSMIGYAANSDVSSGTTEKLTFIFGPVVGLFFIAGAAALRKSAATTVSN